MESAGEGAKRIYGEGLCEELLSRRWAGFMESAGEGLHSSCTRDSRGIPQEFGRNSAARFRQPLKTGRINPRGPRP